MKIIFTSDTKKKPTNTDGLTQDIFFNILDLIGDVIISEIPIDSSLTDVPLLKTHKIWADKEYTASYIDGQRLKAIFFHVNDYDFEKAEEPDIDKCSRTFLTKAAKKAIINVFQKYFTKKIVDIQYKETFFDTKIMIVTQDKLSYTWTNLSPITYDSLLVCEVK